jgi:hypothetical protein
VFRRGFAAPAAGAPKLSGTAKAKLEKEKRMKKRRAKLMLFKVRCRTAVSLIRDAAQSTPLQPGASLHAAAALTLS